MTDTTATTRDGRTLHLERHGEGAPFVVLEAGMGMSRNGWGAVIAGIAPHTTVVAYDRSGLGRSEPDTHPRDLARLADDLEDLLASLGDEPVVLVAHSWGGPIVRTLTARVSARVAGLVLVDPTDEGCDLFFGPAMDRQDRVAPLVTSVLSRTGVLRLVARRQAAVLPEPWASAMAAQDGSPAAVRAQMAEMRSYRADLAALRATPPPVPTVAVTIVSGGRAGAMEKRRRGPLVEAHRRSAASAPLGRHVVAERSGHLVPFTEPDLVVTEVLAVVAALRP